MEDSITRNQQEEWFRSWFNSPYYHLLYSNRDEKEAEYFIRNLVSHLEPPQQASMLDIACGRGRHAIFLNRLGFQVDGIDLSEESITYAKQFENERLHFYQHDMRERFALRKYDYVFNLFTSIGYFETHDENLEVIKGAAGSLKKGGTLVIDFFNAQQVIETLPQKYQVDREEQVFQIEKYLKEGFICKDIAIQEKSDWKHFQERVAALTLQDFKQFFRVAGLKLLHVKGDYQLNGFNTKRSPRLVLIGIKE